MYVTITWTTKQYVKEEPSVFLMRWTVKCMPSHFDRTKHVRRTRAYRTVTYLPVRYSKDIGMKKEMECSQYLSLPWIGAQARMQSWFVLGRSDLAQSPVLCLSRGKEAARVNASVYALDERQRVTFEGTAAPTQYTLLTHFGGLRCRMKNDVMSSQASPRCCPSMHVVVFFHYVGVDQREGPLTGHNVSE